MPGLPGVLIGSNDRIAWGVSTINVDSQDLYIEQVNDQNQVLYQDEWAPLQVAPETIRVRGAAPVALNVRISRHGPLISDVVSPTGPALAVRWTGHDGVDEGLLAALAVSRADDWASFTRAFRNDRPANMNYVYADRAGNIGYIAAGTIPIRAQGDGSLLAPGWTGTHEWTGYVPTAELPQRFNPPEGFVVASNNRVVDDSYPYPIGSSYAAPYRAARAIELIEARPRHSAEVALLEEQPWCDDVTTPTTETCADLLALALTHGLNDMAAAQSNAQLAAWRWDRVHRAQFPHQALGTSAAHGPRFNRSIPNDGDRFTVNVASSFRAWEEYDQYHAAQYRQIVDLRRLSDSRWIVCLLFNSFCVSVGDRRGLGQICIARNLSHHKVCDIRSRDVRTFHGQAINSDAVRSSPGTIGEWQRAHDNPLHVMPLNLRQCPAMISQRVAQEALSEK